MTSIEKTNARRPDHVDGEDPAAPTIGRWYWIRSRDGESEWLGCVVKIGSNYAKLDSPVHSALRIHFDEFFARCRHEPDHQAIIDGRVEHARREIKVLTAKVRELTDRLAITPGLALGNGGETSALALRGGNEPVEAYKTALVEAKEKTLPELFDSIKKQSEIMRDWLTAPLLPMEAQADAIEPLLRSIKNRIFSVELYAGLVEQVEQFADGEPAPMTEKIHLMQRRCYMDEECLAQYEAGGMDISSLDHFDRWLARPGNRDRILPHPRCVVAFRVRRDHKHRDAWDIGEFMQILQERETDEYTFLYMRNGERLFRLRTAIEFDEQLFPDAEHRVINDAIYAKPDASSRDKKRIITENEYRAMVEEEERAKEKRHFRDSKEYHPFRRESVYYDDIAEMVQETMARHNRLVLVLQGILDRSPVFHPHPPWQVWTNDGFEQALALVYDDSRALVAGEKPDFESYQKKCNESFRAGAIAVGQQVAWELHEGKKEMIRQRENGVAGWYRYKGRRHRPYGNPGPGTLARIVEFRRTGTCVFAWNRAGAYRSGEPDRKIRCAFTIHRKSLLCVDGYRPGDFRIFFSDPRTRADYLQWAPMLLAAEDYHAGKRKIVEPPVPEPKKSSEDGRWRYQKMLARRAVDGKVVRTRGEIVRRDGKKYAKGTLWIAKKDRGDLFNINGCDERGRVEKGNRFVRDVHMRDLEVVDPQPTPSKAKK